jgi:hypothetical protein
VPFFCARVMRINAPSDSLLMIVEPNCSAVDLGQDNWKQLAGAALISFARGGPTHWRSAADLVFSEPPPILGACFKSIDFCLPTKSTIVGAPSALARGNSKRSERNQSHTSHPLAPTQVLTGGEPELHHARPPSHRGFTTIAFFLRATRSALSIHAERRGHFCDLSLTITHVKEGTWHRQHYSAPRNQSWSLTIFFSAP